MRRLSLYISIPDNDVIKSFMGNAVFFSAEIKFLQR